MEIFDQFKINFDDEISNNDMMELQSIYSEAMVKVKNLYPFNKVLAQQIFDMINSHIGKSKVWSRMYGYANIRNLVGSNNI